ncbi:MAG: DUF6796 family protein [Sphaerochaetaceae bacterium]
MNRDTQLDRMMGILSITAAAVLTAADYLLEFHSGYGLGTSVVEPAWLTMGSWRFTLSIHLCLFMIPFYLAGFFLLHKALSRTHRAAAVIIPVLFSYGVIMGSPFIHGVMNLNALVYKNGVRLSISAEVLTDLIENTVTAAILPGFLFHYIITWIIAPCALFFTIISGKSVFRRWTAFLNPLVFLIAGTVGLKLLPSVFAYLAPGAINKGNLAMFTLVTVKMWKRKAEPD